MAVIVRHKETGAAYVFLGGGFGAWKSSRPSMFLGSVASTDDSGELPVALVCDAHGAPRWLKTEELEIVSVDGEAPAALLEAVRQNGDT